MEAGRIAFPVAGALAVLLLGAAAEPSPVIEAALHAPSDSHEPQRARLILRNTGAERIAGPVAYACRFLGGDGTVLARASGSVPAIEGGATARAEALYSGWPRARSVTCEPAPRPAP